MFGNQNVVSEPVTSDAQANAFVASFDMSLECDQQLRALDESMRLKVLSVLHSKMSQTSIQNPSTYLIGIIRNEKKRQVPTRRLAALRRTGLRLSKAPSPHSCCA